jgi:ADP-ribosylglycohydrolase
MALCLADSLLANDGLDETDLMKRFVRWWRTGENSVNGRCFDIGNTTREALEAFHRTGVWKVDREDPHSAGNGSLMRLAPAVLFAAPNPQMAMELADRQSRTTHRAAVAHDASRFLAELLIQAVTGAGKDELMRSRQWTGTAELSQIASGNWKKKCRQEISSSGYVLHTLEAALWSVHRSNSFEEALICAVNLGEDSDSVGAVTGQLAGALWGLDGIPERWLAKLAWRKQIEQKAVALFRAGQ